MRKFGDVTRLCAAAVVGMLVLAASAQAQSPGVGKKAGDILLRLRGIAFVPDERASIDPIGGDTKLSSETVPEIDISYFITDNIALELIAATTSHSVQAVNTSIGRVDLGGVNTLPPVLSLQYHFVPDYWVSPYIGGSVNYTHFYDEDAPGGTVTDIDYDDTFGYGVQLGADFRITDRLSANFDVKYLWINTDVEINNGAIDADVNLNPWIIGVGMGYRF